MFGFIIKKPTVLPRCIWACKSAMDDYEWKNTHPSELLEIALCNSSERSISVNGVTYTVSGKTICCTVGDFPSESSAARGVKVEITSVAVEIAGLSFEARDFTESDLADKDVLLMPHFTESLGEKELSEFERLLNKYIGASVEKTAADEMLKASVIFELLYRLDGIARRRVRRKEKYIGYYVTKTDSIIRHSYAKHLTLEGIAGGLGITPNYLSALYKDAEGVSFSEALGAVRAKKAAELLRDTELTVSEIAERVGFSDESNLRRCFKRHFGVTLREYRCIEHEQTLYHNKPVRGD